MEPSMSRSSRAFLCSLTLLLPLFSCSQNPPHHRSLAYGYGTNWEIHLYEGEASFAEEIADFVSSSSLVLDPKASAVPDGLSALNSSRYLDKPSPFLSEAIALGEKTKGESGGSYSFSLGRLTAAWKSSLEKKEVLGDEVRLSLLEEARSTYVEKEGERVYLRGNGELDFSSLGKGLCLKHILGMLQEKNITKYFINAGTSSMLFGENVVNEGYVTVHLEDAPGKSFRAKNCALSTSSVAKQGVEIDGVLYSHIIDPETGRADLGDVALCLVGEDPALLDAYSTAYLAKGGEGLEELSSKGIAYAYMKEGKVLADEGLF